MLSLLRFLGFCFLFLVKTHAVERLDPQAPHTIIPSYFSYLENQAKEALRTKDMDKMTEIVLILSEDRWLHYISRADTKTRKAFFQLLDLIIEADISRSLDKTLVNTFLLRFVKSEIFSLRLGWSFSGVVQDQSTHYLKKWVKAFQNREKGVIPTDEEKSILKNIYPLLIVHEEMRPWLLSTIEAKIKSREYRRFLLSKEGSVFFKDKKTRKRAYRIFPWYCRNLFDHI